MIDIKSMLPEEILEFTAKELKAPKFRANQIMDWLSKGVTKFEDMKNLPKNIVETLNSICYISVANIEKKLKSSYDETVKYLFSFSFSSPESFPPLRKLWLSSITTRS